MLIGIAAFFVSIGSSIAGGGGGLIMTPLMIIMGFPPQTVLASAKASGLGINIGALSKFTREKNVINWRWAGLLSGLALIAALIGTRIVFVFDNQTLKSIVGVVTVSLVPIIFFSRKIGLEDNHVSRSKQVLGTVLYFIIMVAQAGIGSGIGSLLMFVLMGLMGFGALRANATKRVVGLALVIVSFTIFAFSGYMNWVLALSLGSGMLFGGYIGAHLAVKHGNLLVKRALLLVSFIVGLSVLLS